MNKTSTAKRKSEWISSSFGGATDDSFTTGKLNKQTDHVIDLTGGKCSENHAEYKPWVDKNKPSCENDLAVHKKKVQDVKHRLQGYFIGETAKNEAAILLLSGPAGSGKTALVEVLAKQLDCELKEWINPVGQDYQDRSSSNWRDYLSRQDSQSQVFNDFLLRANRYNGLSMVGEDMEEKTRKIVLIEDLPNFILRDPQKLHAMLRVYLKCGRNPLVFIMSDTYTSDCTVHAIFPKSIQTELHITNISFNGVATTSLTKAMNKIVKDECKINENIVVPSKEMYDLLAANCNGDIRSCINSLQFYCTNIAPTAKDEANQHSRVKKKGAAKQEVKVKQKSKKDSKENLKPSVEESASFCGRDASLFLFRALGKILYCKRVSNSNLSEPQLPVHLKEHARNTLQNDPEEVFERTQIASDTFVLYLHQNYPQFYSDIDSLSSASNYVSDADIMTGVWANRQVMSDYCSSTAMRGIMFCNRSASSSTGAVSGGWRSLHKPQFFESFKSRNENARNCKELFQETRQTSSSLFTEVLPYVCFLDASLLKTHGHKRVAHEIGRFQRNKQRPSNLQTLSDGMQDMSHETDLELGQRYKLTNPEELDISVVMDEEIIEDFDDP